MVSAANIADCSYISFSLRVLLFSWLCRSILSIMCRFLLFIICMARFSIRISYSIFSLSVLGFPILFHFLKQFKVVQVHMVIDIFLRFVSLPMNLMGMWLSGIITITICNGDRASLWKIPLWILSSAIVVFFILL